MVAADAPGLGETIACTRTEFASDHAKLCVAEPLDDKILIHPALPFQFTLDHPFKKPFRKIGPAFKCAVSHPLLPVFEHGADHHHVVLDLRTRMLTVPHL